MIVARTFRRVTLKEILGKNVRLLRQSRGLSLDELSERIGMNRGHLNEIELAYHHVRLDTIELIAGALELPPHQLLDPATSRSIQAKDGTSG